MHVQMTNIKPVKPGYYILSTHVGYNLLAEVCLIKDVLCVYCNAINLHSTLDEADNSWRWSIEDITVDWDSRVN